MSTAARPATTSAPLLPAHFRRLPIEERIALLAEAYGYDPAAPPAPAAAERMIEAAIGHSAIPLGVAPRVRVNDRWYCVPLATEEPSVVAGQIFAAAIIARHGGVEAVGSAALGVGQVVIQRCSRGQYRGIRLAWPRIISALERECASLQRRGGGLQRNSVRLYRQRLGAEAAADGRGGGGGGTTTTTGSSGRARERQRARLAILEFTVDTVDAMGANRITLIAESLAHWLKSELGCRILMAILSNDLAHSPSTARFRLPTRGLRGLSADPIRHAHDIVAANAVAAVNLRRAVTHNKGVMNGIAALALATGNDTRAVEAAAHSYAARGGRYHALTRYRLVNDELRGELTVPIPLATVGGAITTQHHAQQATAIVSVRNGAELRAVAAAVGLQQNFAALMALTSEGITRGHLPLQRKREQN